jgi:hypothetical protein
MISGSTKGTNEDDESNINRKTIVDLLEAKGISWKTYQEDYPGMILGQTICFFIDICLKATVIKRWILRVMHVNITHSFHSKTFKVANQDVQRL